jgi:hypothetical protein
LLFGLLGCAGSSGSDGNGASAGHGNTSASGSSATSGGSAAGGSNALGGTGDRGGAGANSSGNSGTGAAPAAPFVALQSVARRLSRAEFDNVLSDVLRDTTSPASKALVEDEYAPYDNDYTLQSASQALIDGLSALAEDVAKRAMSDATRRATLVPCTPQGAGDAACFRQTIEQLGARLLRRPLTSDEVSAYATLQTFATENNPSVAHDFYTAVELFLRAVLQDPEFLYRIEVGTPTATPGVSKLGQFEIASRLSFLIWGSTPDDALGAEARTGALESASAREATARRLLNDERARAQLHRYHSLWLGYRAIPHPVSLTREFQMETTALIDRVVFEEHRNYFDLFTLPETFLDVALADHYGLPHPSGAEGWVAYGNSGRAGILSHGSAACHGQIDPIGLGLEKYDIAGRYREHDDGAPACLLEGVGELPGHGAFQGPGELAKKLTENGLIEACAVRQYLTFAAGRRLRADEQAFVDAELASLRANSRDFSAMIVALAGSEAFTLRKEPTP